MRLICIEGKEKGNVWEITGARTIVGRDSMCDIIIDDKKLSRIHAEIIKEGKAFIFLDKESLNGSFINNYRVSRQVLIPDDEIRIGDTKIKVLKEDLSTSIRWKEDDPLITSKVPLDLLSSQIEEAVGSPGVTVLEVSEVPTKRHALVGRLLKNLETIYEVGNAINSIQSLDEQLNQISERLLGVFPDVQRVCILLKRKGEDFEPKCIKSRGEVQADAFQISRSIVKRSVQEEVCILANDAFHDDRFSASESVLTMNLRSVMCAPLVSKGDVLGLIYLDNREKPSCFDENDVTLLSALANQSAIAIENSRLYEDLQKAYHEAILALMNTVEAKDPYTRGHSQRTSRYALGIAQEMGLSEEDCERIKTAAELHDIGKIGVREQIIGKESPLSTVEFHSIQAHVLTGENILRPIEYLNFALPMVRHHHEHYDGTGYPDGLKGEEIPLGARIIGVADAFDAMTTQRPYNKPLPFEKALEKCKSSKGKQFDLAVVDGLARFIEQNYKATPPTDEFPKTEADIGSAKQKKAVSGKK
jgi:HD-GYP domain-containing protein (c-di-GMP phosphodiesterase class II)/pSer/pThr/pTyr-binding forkhead associated (FHA) protein